MPVSSTVTSVREQIREGVKLSLDNNGYTPVATSRPFSDMVNSSSYPLVKAFYDGKPTLETQFIGNDITETDVLFIDLVPACTVETYELETAKLLETCRPFIRPDVVRALMDASYQNGLVDIVTDSILIGSTGQENPYAFVRLSCTVKYRLTA